MSMHTGQIEPDAILAASVAAGVFLMAASVQHFLISTYTSYATYQMLLLDALRYSDFLLYSKDGLAVDRDGLVLDHVVDCGKVYAAYENLLDRGFSGYVACSTLRVGSGDPDIVVRRRAVWNGVPVTVEVGYDAPYS